MEALCSQMEWSLLNATSNFSSFSGLAASLVLASMVIILVEYKGEENPATAVALFTVTLLALGSDTFIFGAASGEVLCGRGVAQGLLAGSTLATGVAILLLGVTLLQAKFKHTHAALTLLGNVVTCLGAAGIMALLALWSVRAVNNLTILRLRPGPMTSYAPALILIGVFLVIIVVIALVGPGDRVRHASIIVTTCVYLVHILVTFAMYGATIVIAPTQWTVQLDPLVLVLTVVIAIVFPFVELTGVVISLDWRGGAASVRATGRRRSAPGRPRTSSRNL